MSSALPPPPAARPVLVGFSGGVDSTVLLHWLASAPDARAQGLRALHVHHGLQADADAWAEHCARVCAALQVPLLVVPVTVEDHHGEGLEAAARAARHAAFASALHAGEALALAHHRDDQAETFLLRALRASGPDGLAAMAVQRPFAAGTLWRPLLEQPRAALRAYADAQALEWIEDPSNARLEHDRNFLRHRVLPLLAERWPHAAAALARSATLSGEAAALLGEDDPARLACLLAADGGLELHGLGLHPPARRARLLRHWVARHALPPLPAQGLAMLQAELDQPAADRDTCFAWHGAEIRRWRQRLYLRRPTPAWPPHWQAPWDGRTALALPDGGQLQLHGTDGFETPLLVCARHGGERLQLPGRTHSHALKHLLQQAEVPPWRRATLPLLFAGEQLQAAGDQLLSAGFAAWLQARGARLQHRPGDAAN